MSLAAPSEQLIKDILAVLEKLAGGPHAGFRPVHAKGAFCTGTFTPTPAAAKLTRAPHATKPSTPIVVRFSNAAGVPTVSDNDPAGGGPRGFAVRFMLAPHVHTDIVSHSANAFPAQNGEEFLELIQAAAASGPDAPKPTPVEKFLGSHPKTLHFVQLPKPFPTSFSREAFFAMNAFKFTNSSGESKLGRFKVRPVGGTEYLSTEESAKQSANYLHDELSARLGKGAIDFKLVVQLATDADNVIDPTTPWPDDRAEIEFGTITLSARANDANPELRKLIFDPVPRVDGIDSSGDPIIEVRSAIYLLSGRKRRAAIAK